MKIDQSANDHTPAALAAAAQNHAKLVPYWHNKEACSADPDDFDNLAYYRCPKTGEHGWMCAHCRAVVQTG